MKRFVENILLGCVMAGMAWSCANPGTPTGGPRDYRPPVMMTSTPAPGAQNFNEKIITLQFDENIQVKDADKKFVVSPPILPAPKVDGHGKTIRVRFDPESEMLPNTTYTLDFADCVSDLNEGNVLENFTFSFSTGETADSMMISGNLYDAESLEPLNGVYILLHENLTDTALHKVSPVRIAKTDATGRFAIKNVAADKEYKVYALDDQNRNFLYDAPGEKVAFWSGSVKPGWEIRQLEDSVKVDSLSMSIDSTQWVYEKIMRDTLVYTPDSLKLFAFAEDVYQQYITLDERKQRNMVKLVFNRPMKDKVKIAFPGHDDEVSNHAVVQHGFTNDTVMVWVTDTLIWKKDSLVISATYPVLDSLENMVMKTDTLTMWHFEKAPAKKSGRKNRNKEEEKPELPSVKLAVGGRVADYQTVGISIESPIDHFEWDSVGLFLKVDTVLKRVDYKVYEDTVELNKVRLKADWKPGEKYVLAFDTLAVFDIYGVSNKPKKYEIAISSMEQFGTLYIDVDSVPENGVLQVMDAACKKVLRQNRIGAKGKVAFRYLKPGEYMLRILVDRNGNGKWDKGDFDGGVQPEELMFYMEKVSVRANWDIKVDFTTRGWNLDKFVKKFKMKGGDKRRKTR